MTPLPPQERLAIYRKVLEEIPVYDELGLCSLLYTYSPKRFRVDGMRNLFPEYAASEQIHQRQESAYWFPIYDFASRVTVVEGWIKQVEEELTNQPQG